ncbi:hypothetical protein BCR42DRAFT_448556 [Absidia repens]|uniref:Uncharacterized protein n=1 Tax=Absidia repens TaxID=90262 RepID=A0A1X2IR56_9FUNG|nr:hypothetical protein BCR42DRAFT_448556 [Absidia repens]
MDPNNNIELPDYDEEMVDDEPTLEQLENSLLETSNDDAMGKKKKLVDAISSALESAEDALLNNLKESQQLVINSATTSDEAFEANEKRRAFLKSRIESLKDQKNSYQEKRKVVNIPKNLPLLQLIGDLDAIKNKTCYETIDKFIDTFEMIILQHSLEVETAWEPCFISTIQHSLDKSAWYRNTLMKRNYGWTYAKNIIKTKFSGDRSQSHYLQQLIEMTAARNDNPIQFIEKFYNTLQSTGSQDSAAYGTILLRALQQHHPDFVKQVRLVNASTKKEQRPELTVAFISDIAPILSVEELISERRNNNHYSRKSSTTFKKERQLESAPYSKSDKFKGKDKKCFYCSEVWTPTHRCQAYVDYKSKQYEKKARMAQLDKDQIKEEVQKVLEEKYKAKKSQDIDMTDVNLSDLELKKI